MKSLISYFKASLLLTTIFFITQNVSSQWLQTSGPVGGHIYSLELSGSNVLVGGLGGGFFSSDNGSSWNNLGTGLPADKHVYGFSVSGNTIYAATWGGVYKSTDGGAAWNYSSSGITAQLIFAVKIHGSYVFASAYNEGIYRSSDNGASWQMTGAGEYTMGFTTLGNAIYSMPHLGGGVIRSTDFGNTWTAVNNGITDLDGECIYTDGTNLYYGTLGGKFFISTNGGNDWTDYTNGLVTNNWIGSIIVSSGKIILGTMSGMYVSTNGGLNWSEHPAFTAISVVELEKTGSTIIAGTFARGIYVSSDNGVTWINSNSGLVNTEVNSLGQFAGRIFAGCYGGRISTSTDGALSWTDPGSGVPGGGPVKEFASFGSNIYAAAVGGVYQSSNNGVTWVSAWQPAIGSFAIKTQGEYFYEGTYDGIFWSSDKGLTWNNALAGSIVYAIEVKGSNVYVSTNNPVSMYLSTNSGQSFSAINNGLPSGIAKTITSKGSNVFAGLSYGSTGYGVYRTTNNGASWSAVNNGLSNLYVNNLYVQGNTIFAATKYGVFSSTNDGDSWSNDVSSGMLKFSVSSFLKIGPDLYAGTTNYGVWKRSLNEMMPNYRISGQITYKDNNQPVPNGGFVKALYYDPAFSKIYVIDSAGIGPEGMYTLTKAYQENIYIMVYQDDDLLQFVPTYNPEGIDWRLASVVQPTENMSGVNIKVERINNTPNPYSISGKVLFNGQGLDNAYLYAKIGNVYKNYGISNTNGDYVITKLPNGTYTLLVYRIGYNPQTLTVTINNSSIQNFNINMDSFVGNNNGNTNIPQTYNLYQNYPNPFNPVTSIKFDIPKEGLVRLTVYDVLGKEIAVLVNDNLKAGVYKVDWNASNYSSGIYFYRIESGNFIETKRMILIK